MKVVRKGNTYKRMSWLKEREEDIYLVLTVIVVIGVIVLTSLIGD